MDIRGAAPLAPDEEPVPLVHVERADDILAGTVIDIQVRCGSQSYQRSSSSTGLEGRTLLCEDDIADIAEHFDTSEFVIRHQLENHNLAHLA